MTYPHWGDRGVREGATLQFDPGATISPLPMPQGPHVTVERQVGPHQVLVLPYRAGATMKQYLQEAGWLGLIGHVRVSDQSNPAAGRCRMSYIPQDGAHLVLMNPNMSLASGLQRASGAKKQDVEEIDLGYRDKPAAQEDDKGTFHDIEQL